MDVWRYISSVCSKNVSKLHAPGGRGGHKFNGAVLFITYRFRSPMLPFDEAFRRETTQL